MLAACTFDLQFYFVYPGWEGFANNQRVLADIFLREGFKVFNSKYYLGNIGYINIGNILTPFRRIRYYLREIIITRDIPEMYQELFNL